MLTLLDIVMGEDLGDRPLSEFETLLRETRREGTSEQVGIVARDLLARWPGHPEAVDALAHATRGAGPRLPQLLEAVGFPDAEPDTTTTITLKDVIEVGRRAWNRLGGSPTRR